MTLTALGLLAGCVSGESGVRKALKNNPDIVFDVISENPEAFMDVVNRAAQTAQRGQQEKRAAARRESRERDLKNPKKPVLAADRRLSGKADAKIVIVEYADFQCPACAAGYVGLKKIKETYGDDVAFYYKNYPLNFHPLAAPAALYYEALMLQDREKARKFHAHVFEKQRSMRDESFLKDAAQSTGADMKRLSKDMKSEKLKQRISADMQEFEQFGFTGTPVVIVNGVALEGAQSFESLEEAIELTKNKELAP
jgi:protein-disulfide isomerase